MGWTIDDYINSRKTRIINGNGFRFYLSEQPTAYGFEFQFEVWEVDNYDNTAAANTVRIVTPEEGEPTIELWDGGDEPRLPKNYSKADWAMIDVSLAMLAKCLLT